MRDGHTPPTHSFRPFIILTPYTLCGYAHVSKLNILSYSFRLVDPLGAPTGGLNHNGLLYLSRDHILYPYHVGHRDLGKGARSEAYGPWG